MVWSAVRFELGRTRVFPKGSAGRAYIVHLPLTEAGLIDAQAFNRAPSKAIVRRFWPGEADLVGFVVPVENGWAFSYQGGPNLHSKFFELDVQHIKRGEYLTVREPDGSELAYTIAEVAPLVTPRRGTQRPTLT